MAAATQDLTTLAAVRQYLQRQQTTDATDNELQALITAVSDEMIEYTGCEFAPASTAVSRKFVYYGRGMLHLTPYSLRSVTSITMDTDGSAPNTDALTLDDYRLWPRQPRDGVYSRVELRVGSPSPTDSSVDYIPTRQVTIVGNWGYATIPTNIAKACDMTVAFQLRHGSSYFGHDGSMDVPRFGPVMFPTSVKSILDRYRNRGI